MLDIQSIVNNCWILSPIPAKGWFNFNFWHVNTEHYQVALFLVNTSGDLTGLCLYMSDWIKMLDVRIQRKSPPHNNQLGFLRFWREPQPLVFVNIPSIILRPDKYNTIIDLIKNFALSKIGKHKCHQNELDI